ncbi:MAG: DUF362 domain-containing protein [Lachnospiraceae bacterium]|nr:DUF362 domain-containing protein [Lachnospiraceae bacterium]
MRKGIAIIHRKEACYPAQTHTYAPSEAYPEYRGGDIAPGTNSVYDMVREGFRALHMDREHFGTPEWDPLGEVIRPGDTVLLKPNFVMHENPAGGIDCLVTHASVLRAVLDYVLIATRGEGRIIIGDAPVQSCDFDLLLKNANYNILEERYANVIAGARFHDFRNTVVTTDATGILLPGENTRHFFGCKTVRLDEESAFAGLEEEKLKRLRITNYRHDTLHEHHHTGHHAYLISDALLTADVVINLPKPKTHRKAGVTGAMKNMIGVNASKEYLPHHTLGDKQHGGDEYLYASRIKSLYRTLQEKRDDANADGALARARRFSFLSALAAQGHKIKKPRDPYREGSWYGNDTIWRTIADIHKIVLFADKEGILREVPQRKQFVIADMIVSGAGEGPLHPAPWEMHRILMGEDPALTDYALTKLFGLPAKRIPSIRQLCDPEKIKHTRVLQNSEDRQELLLPALRAEQTIPLPEGWQRILED